MSETVTMSRAEYEALLDRLEDAEDMAAIAAARARETALGIDAAYADYLPIEAVEKLLAGVSPVRVWREHRGLTQRVLAATAGISTSYLCEIESGAKPGSFDAMLHLAKALKLSTDDLAPAAHE